MQIKSSEKNHERTKPFYGSSRWIARRKERNREHRGRLSASVAAIEKSISLGSDQGSNGEAMASSRKECRWRARAAFGCKLICGDDSVDGFEAIELQRNGRIFGRECGGKSIHRQTNRDKSTDTGSLKHSANNGWIGVSRDRTDQWNNIERISEVRICRPNNTFGRYHSTGTTNWISQRTRDIARGSSAMSESFWQTEKSRQESSRRSYRAGQNRAQVGQTASPFRQ